jgi:hypothetical protein
VISKRPTGRVRSGDLSPIKPSRHGSRSYPAAMTSTNPQPIRTGDDCSAGGPDSGGAKSGVFHRACPVFQMGTRHQPLRDDHRARESDGTKKGLLDAQGGYIPLMPLKVEDYA